MYIADEAKLDCQNPDEQGVLRRSDRVADTPSGLSRFTEVVLNQGMSIYSSLYPLI
jgi:hypothetical protein